MSGYNIAKNFETVYSHLWRASHQQVYKEFARLYEQGICGHPQPPLKFMYTTQQPSGDLVL
jgi:hypothetical protein